MIEIIFKNLTTEEVEALTKTLRRMRAKRKHDRVALDNFDPPPDEGPGGQK